MIPPVFLYAVLTPIRLGLRCLGWVLLYVSGDDMEESDHRSAFNSIDGGDCLFCRAEAIDDALPQRYPKSAPSRNGARVA